ncbi:MAG: GNAT family N-acetyltransferase [Zymomonas sp.]|nr:MAG: GNAT family N-acetyltransferase [Zymomonas sp.]
MVVDNLVVRSRASSPGLTEAAIRLEDVIWEPFGFLSHTRAHREFYADILEDHADLQLCLVDETGDEPVALANCVPFHYAGDLQDLPQEGWDWLVETGSRPSDDPVNVLGALAVSVPTEHRGKGYAQRMIRELKAMAIARGYDALVVPVRPSIKWQHPHVPMTDYAAWTNDKGEVFDPWLRSHVAQGARIIGACERSMVVEEHVSFWEAWIGHRFDASASYVLKGALAPIEVDLERQTGLYQEPNVWVGYAL